MFPWKINLVCLASKYSQILCSPYASQTWGPCSFRLSSGFSLILLPAFHRHTEVLDLGPRELPIPSGWGCTLEFRGFGKYPHFRGTQKTDVSPAFSPQLSLNGDKKKKNVSILLDFRLTAWPGISCQVVSGKLLNQYPHSISSRKGKGRGKKIIIMLLPNCLSFLQL